MDTKHAVIGHELFASLGPDMARRLSNISSEKRFHAGETIYRKDTLTSHFFVVLDGDVRLQLPETKAVPAFAVGRLHKGELFGLSPLLGFQRYTVTAVAETETTLLAIEVAPFLAMLKADPVASSAVHGMVVRAYYARYLKLLQALQAIAAQLAGD